MLNEEAKKIIYNQWQSFLEHNIDYGGISEAYKKAIKALEQQPCEDAISRKVVNILIDELARATSDERCYMSRGRSTETIMQDILNLPSVTPQPKIGHWICHRDHCENLGVIPSGLGVYEWCSNCDCGIDIREWQKNLYNYCPNCGAKMEEMKEVENDK